MTDEVEVRLRTALAARAGQITQERLRFGVPPTVAATQTRSPRRRWLTLTIGAGIAAAVLGFALAPRSAEPDQPPAPPAGRVVVTPSASSTVPPAPTASEAPSPSHSRSPAASGPALPATSAPGKPTLSPGSPPKTAGPQVTPAG